jgi:hypothetical protein
MASIKMNGLAFDWPNYSKGMYDKVQRAAEMLGGRAATSRHGFFEPAPEPLEHQPIAQTTRMPISDVWAGQRETAPSPEPFLVHYAMDRPTSTGDWRERPALALLAGKACFAVQGF